MVKEFLEIYTLDNSCIVDLSLTLSLFVNDVKRAYKDAYIICCELKLGLDVEEGTTCS